MEIMDKKQKITIFTFLALSLAGILDTFYLTLNKLQHSDVACSILEGCDVVLNSAYSMVGPVPLAAIGFFYYLFIFFGSLFYLSRPNNKKIFKLVKWVTILGLLFSLYFLYLQAFVIGVYCMYCIGSAGISIILASISIKLLIVDRQSSD